MSVNHPVQNPSVFAFLLTPMLSLFLLRNQIQHEAHLVLVGHQRTTQPAVYSVPQNDLFGIYRPYNHEKQRQMLIKIRAT